ncbi:hypothetical protein GCM10010505_05120 [Kitasatospora aburaviensis]
MKSPGVGRVMIQPPAATTPTTTTHPTARRAMLLLGRRYVPDGRWSSPWSPDDGSPDDGVRSPCVVMAEILSRSQVSQITGWAVRDRI